MLHCSGRGSGWPVTYRVGSLWILSDADAAGNPKCASKPALPMLGSDASIWRLLRPLVGKASRKGSVGPPWQLGGCGRELASGPSVYVSKALLGKRHTSQTLTLACGRKRTLLDRTLRRLAIIATSYSLMTISFIRVPRCCGLAFATTMFPRLVITGIGVGDEWSLRSDEFVSHCTLFLYGQTVIAMGLWKNLPS